VAQYQRKAYLFGALNASRLFKAKKFGTNYKTQKAMEERLISVIWYEMHVMPWVIVTLHFEGHRLITFQSLN